MPKRVQLRPLTTAEAEQLEKTARSRTAAVCEVERARVLLALAQQQRPEDIAQMVGCAPATVYNILRRFHERGLASLADAPRSGRPFRYDETQRGQLVVTAKTHPEQLSQPFGHWTLDRLVAYAHQTLQIPISRSQLGEILEAEGLKWYQEKTYFSERPDPQFAEKRGP